MERVSRAKLSVVWALSPGPGGKTIVICSLPLIRLMSSNMNIVNHTFLIMSSDRQTANHVPGMWFACITHDLRFSLYIVFRIMQKMLLNPISAYRTFGRRHIYRNLIAMLFQTTLQMWIGSDLQETCVLFSFCCSVFRKITLNAISFGPAVWRRALLTSWVFTLCPHHVQSWVCHKYLKVHFVLSSARQCAQLAGNQAATPSSPTWRRVKTSSPSSKCEGLPNCSTCLQMRGVPVKQFFLASNQMH